MLIVTNRLFDRAETLEMIGARIAREIDQLLVGELADDIPFLGVRARAVLQQHRREAADGLLIGRGWQSGAARCRLSGP